MILPKLSKKSREIEKILGLGGVGGACRGRPSLDPPLESILEQENAIFNNGKEICFITKI